MDINGHLMTWLNSNFAFLGAFRALFWPAGTPRRDPRTMLPYGYVRSAALCQSRTSFGGERLQNYHGAHGDHGADSSVDTPCPRSVSVVNILDALRSQSEARSIRNEMTLTDRMSSTGMTRDVGTLYSVIPGASPGIHIFFEPQSTQRSRSGFEYGYSVSSVVSVVNILDAPRKACPPARGADWQHSPGIGANPLI